MQVEQKKIDKSEWKKENVNYPHRPIIYGTRAFLSNQPVLVDMHRIRSIAHSHTYAHIQYIFRSY